MDKLDFLDEPEGEPTRVEDVAPEAEVAPVVETAPEPEPAVANPLVAPVIDHKPEPGFVPITAVLDERDKRKALEAELAKYRSQAPVEVPDRDEDPDAYEAHREAEIQQRITNIALNQSESVCRMVLGDAKVDAAKEWAIQRFNQSPAYRAEVLSDPNPYGRVVKDHEQSLKVERISAIDDSEFAQFQQWKAAQAAITTQPAATPSVMPSPSIASATSAGGIGHIPTGPGTAFDATFKN